MHAGECYFIPAGTVHAIGAGCLICEIQQNSNLTYRLYDYGRRDADGKTRTLHIEKALSVMQGTPYMPHLPPLPVDEEETLGFCPYFRVAKRTVKGDALVFADVASFRALIAIHGEGLIDGARTAAGDTYLIPAGERAMLSGDLVLLSVSVRRYRLKKADKNLLLTDDLGRIHAKGSAEDSDPKEFLSRYGLTLSDVNGIV